jgi:phosphoglycerol transferase MdoB-like AlkP superfamily enzyme
MIGLVVAFIVFKFGTQLSKAVSDAYKNYETWVPLLAYIFQIIAIVILYSVSSGIASQYFTSAPWAYPLIFLLIALLPTLRVVVNLVHALDNSSGTKHSTNN